MTIFTTFPIFHPWVKTPQAGNFARLEAISDMRVISPKEWNDRNIVRFCEVK